MPQNIPQTYPYYIYIYIYIYTKTMEAPYLCPHVKALETAADLLGLTGLGISKILKLPAFEEESRAFGLLH